MFSFPGWEHFITERVPEWRKHTISWITEYKGPLHIVFYEDMVSNFYEEMYKLFTFLGLSVTYRDIWCASVNQEGRYHRVDKPEWLKSSDLFSSKMKALVKENINLVSNAIKTNNEQKYLLLDEYTKT